MSTVPIEIRVGSKAEADAIIKKLKEAGITFIPTGYGPK